MRKLVLLTTLALMSATAAHGQKLLADANDDGKVTATEYQNNRRAFLMRGDHDKDGKLSPAEWKKGADQVRDEVRATGTDGWALIGKANLFATLDTDKNGFVTPGEIDALSGKRFVQYDLDHDGVITRKEARELDRRAPKP